MIGAWNQPATRHALLLALLAAGGLACGEDEGEAPADTAVADTGEQPTGDATIQGDTAGPTDADGADAGQVDGGADGLEHKDAGGAIESTLCDPCMSSTACANALDSAAKCVDHGASGAFCAGSCADDGDCVVGYACKDSKSVEGATAKLCLPKGETNGSCECSAAAISKSLWTNCTVASPGGGACQGKRYCGSGGLSACDAAPASPEACNGGDDDCDGETDEAGCDDGDPCTTDACVDAKCATTPATGACDDGDVCTEGEQCVEGACAGGSAKDCDDGDPCTDDSCDATKGCEQTPAVAGCDDNDACTTGEKCVEGVCGGGVEKSCDDGVVCTDDSCDGTTGVCTNEISLALCDDGDPCTSDSACGPDAQGNPACSGGQAKDCDDLNPCTTDSCSPQLGCVSKPDTGLKVPCYSGAPNTEGVGACKAGAKACQADGSMGACQGESLPALKESCNGLDDDCNGKTDEGCVAAKNKVVGRLASVVVVGKTQFGSMRLRGGGSTVAGPAKPAAGGTQMVTGFYAWLAEFFKAP